MNPSYFIIMADMYESSKMLQPSTQKKFATHVDLINHEFANEIISPLTITLGDEFQGIVKSFEAGIKIIIAFEEKLVFEDFPYKLRYVVNYGEIDSEINTEICHGMIGEGFSTTRKSLNIIKKIKQKYWVISEDRYQLFRNSFILLEMFYKKWEQKKEGNLLYMFLVENKKYDEIALYYGVSKSQIWKKQKSFNINEYIAMKNIINETIYNNS